MITDFELPAIPDNYELNSVTYLLNTLGKPFDAPAKALEMARREFTDEGDVLRKQQDLLNAWSAKGEASRNAGTMLHLYISKVLSGGLDPIEAMLEKTPRMLQFDKFWRMGHKTMTPVWVEQRIWDLELHLIGILDSLFYSSKTDKHHIIDWKSGAYKTNYYDHYLPPFEYLPANSDNAGSLQTSLYRLMVERASGFELGDSYTIYLSDDTYVISKGRYFKDEMLAWLKEFNERLGSI